MKKRSPVILTSALIILFLLAGGVWGSNHGLFDGYPIIKLYVDGKQITSDVPAINLKGRTMVPLRFIGEEMGADFRFDADEYAVYMEMPETPEPGIKEQKQAVVRSYLENSFGNWDIGGRQMSFAVSLDDNYKNQDNLFVSLRIERDDYISWREIKRLHESEIENKIISMARYLQDQYPNSGVNIYLVLQALHTSYDRLAEAFDMKEVTVNSTGQFIVEETLATGFFWPGANKVQVKIE